MFRGSACAAAPASGCLWLLMSPPLTLYWLCRACCASTLSTSSIETSRVPICWSMRGGESKCAGAGGAPRFSGTALARLPCLLHSYPRLTVRHVPLISHPRTSVCSSATSTCPRCWMQHGATPAPWAEACSTRGECHGIPLVSSGGLPAGQQLGPACSTRALAKRSILQQLWTSQASAHACPHS